MAVKLQLVSDTHFQLCIAFHITFPSAKLHEYKWTFTLLFDCLVRVNSFCLVLSVYFTVYCQKMFYVQFRRALHWMWVQLTSRRQAYDCSGIRQHGGIAMVSSCCMRWYITWKTITLMTGPLIRQTHGLSLTALNLSRTTSSRSVHTQLVVAVRGAILILCRPCHKVCSWYYSQPNVHNH